jgi:hypothetical protein
VGDGGEEFWVVGSLSIDFETSDRVNFILSPHHIWNVDAIADRMRWDGLNELHGRNWTLEMGRPSRNGVLQRMRISLDAGETFLSFRQAAKRSGNVDPRPRMVSAKL